MLESLQKIEKTLSKLDKWMGSKKKDKPPPNSEPIWSPLPGPQSMAFFSFADETLYGGAAGVLWVFCQFKMTLY